MKKNIFGKFIYGGDYNPEQWLDRPDILRQDMELMKKARINTVTLGVFSWSALEPQEGVFHFQWLKDMADRLYDNGIHIILATPSGSRPRWLSQKYPEVLRMREDRIRYRYGERHNHCYTSPVYRQKVGTINQKLAEAFREHPAVIMWHISNEYGGECHCPLCQKAFRSWLKNKYQTTDALNHAWWTSFWSHTYDSFCQVESPSSLGEEGLHGLNLDWKRFVTTQTADFLLHEVRSLRMAGALQPVTTNFMEDYTGLNYPELAKHLDYVSWDSYPIWHQPEYLPTAYETGMQHDLMRSMKHKPFLMMESSPSGVNWQEVSCLKRPGLLMTSSLHAIAHGACSVQFFQIRQSRGGFEKFHGAVIDHYGGEDTRVFREVTETGIALEALSKIQDSQVIAPAALIYDMENRWAMENAQGPRNRGLFYHEAVLKSYEALRKNGLNVDVINQEQPLESGIEVSSRADADYEYIFVQNFTDQSIEMRLKEPLDILSGHNYGLLSPLLPFGFDGFICSAGGYIEYEGQVIYDCPMTGEQRERVFSALDESGIYYIMESRDHSYMDESFKIFLKKSIQNHANSELLRWQRQMESDRDTLPMARYQGEPIYKAVFMSPGMEHLISSLRISILRPRPWQLLPVPLCRRSLQG